VQPASHLHLVDHRVAAPDVYRDIVEIVADAPGPLQAKQIVPRIGLEATTAKIEGDPGEAEASGGAELAGRGRAGSVHPRPT